MNVLPVLDAVLARLREKLPQLQVEYFPEKPAEYRLNHPVGALLLSYAGSRFDRPDDTGAGSVFHLNGFGTMQIVSCHGRPPFSLRCHCCFCALVTAQPV